jgi:hypothetical protein
MHSIFESACTLHWSDETDVLPVAWAGGAVPGRAGAASACIDDQYIMFVFVLDWPLLTRLD